ncbi:MAG TPA: hypothetical protein DCM86_10375 [Verrucomicrobiales bacterium]|nr:hypothetical protein [Verrucomicrobiales bacterium]
MTMPKQHPGPDPVAVLRECALFRFFPTSDLERFAGCTRLEHFGPGRLICAKGTSGDRFYVVVRGSVDITDLSPGRGATGGSDPAEAPESPGEILLRTLGAGELFGEVACLEENGVRTANARAREGTTLLIIPREEFLALVQSQPVAAVALVRHLAARVRHYTDDRRALVSPKEYEAETARQETAWHRLAGTAEGWTAHWSFTAVNLVIWTAWLASNGRQLMKELPTITGLTMWLSVQAIVMTTLVLVAQKRADEKEKRRRDLEFQWASATMDRINQVNDRLGHLEQRTPTVAPATGAPES